MVNLFTKLFAGAALAATFGVGASAEQFLRVGTNATYAPWEYVDSAGEFKGFDMDVARAMAEKAGYEGVEIIDIEFDALIANLNSDRFDIIMASMDITDDRLQSIDFIGPYADSPKRAAALVGTYKDVNTLEDFAAALDGKVVGAQAGTTMAIWLEDDFDSNIEVRTYRTFDEIAADVTAGRVDAGLAEVSNWSEYASKNEGKIEQFGPVLNAGVSPTFGNGVGIGIAKDKAELKEKLEKALNELREEGTLKAISEEYFGVDVTL
ncbi:MAG: ABC transporter substrate-binding protein [Alphaproteobacteria bacterium]